MTKCKKNCIFAYTSIFATSLRIDENDFGDTFVHPTGQNASETAKIHNCLIVSHDYQFSIFNYQLEKRRFAKSTLQNRPFFVNIAHFSTKNFGRLHVRFWPTPHVVLAKTTRGLCRNLTWSLPERRFTALFSALPDGVQF